MGHQEGREDSSVHAQGGRRFVGSLCIAIGEETNKRRCSRLALLPSACLVLYYLRGGVIAQLSLASTVCIRCCRVRHVSVVVVVENG